MRLFRILELLLQVVSGVCSFGYKIEKVILNISLKEFITSNLSNCVENWFDLHIVCSLDYLIPIH